MRKSISFLLALLGLFDSLYLLWVYTSPSRPMVCYGGGCDAVRASAYAHFWGVPMPVFGVAGYVLIALLIITESLVPPSLAVDSRFALAGVTGFGFIFSLYLEYLQGFVIHAFCAWCVTSGLVMTALCALAIYNVVHPTLQTDSSAQRSQLRTYFALSAVALLVGVPSFYELAAHGEKPPPPPAPPSESMADKLVRPDSHVFGNPNAPVTVVEFADFECPMCGNEEAVAKRIREKYGNQIRFVFRQFPLTHMHPFAERMAEASECAADQGKFWEAVDEIYSHQTELTGDALKREAAAVGLDMGKFNQCMSSDADRARVDRDHADGKALGVNSTPTIYIGRRPLADVPDFERFSRLIDQALAENGTFPASVPSTASSAASAPPAETKNPSQSAPVAREATPERPNPDSPSTFGTFGSSPGGAFSSFSSDVGTCSEAEAAKKQPNLINTSQLREILAANSKPLFVDVRPPKEYAEGKIPGAINIPVDDISKRWSSLPKNRVIVLYESGKSSGDVCAFGRAEGRFLLEHGFPFDNVKVYQDGLAGWQKAELSRSQ